jgi:polar amino acid transport system substrate-binding protein
MHTAFQGLRRLAVGVGWALFLAVPAAPAAELVAYNTYLFPPFANEDGSGVASTLVAFLNRHFKGQHTFKLENIPRARLLAGPLGTEGKFDGVALLLAPPFVSDADKTRYLWSRPLFEDHNVLVFRGPHRPKHTKLKELQGLTMGAIRGNQYAGLDDMVERGELKLDVSSSELDNLRKVALGRVDFTQMARLLYFSLIAKWGLGGQLVAIPRLEAAPFQRHVFVGLNNPGLAAQIDHALAALPCDVEWQREARVSGFEVPACVAPK